MSSFFARFVAVDLKKECSFCFRTFLSTQRKMVQQIKSKGRICKQSTLFTFERKWNNFRFDLLSKISLVQFVLVSSSFTADRL